MPRSLFYAGLISTIAAAMIAVTRGMELLVGIEVFPAIATSEEGSILVLVAVLTIAAYFLRISVSILVRNMFAGVVASISIVSIVVSEAFRVGAAGVVTADVLLPVSYLSGFAVALMMLAVRSYFDLRIGEASWVFSTPAIFFLGALSLEVVSGSTSAVFYAPFLLGVGASLGIAAFYGLGHRRIFFESVALRSFQRIDRGDEDGLSLTG